MSGRRPDRLLTLGIGVAVALALAEGLVRLVAPQPRAPLLSGLGPEGLARLDPRYGWAWTP